MAGSGARDSMDACMTTIMQYTGNASMNVVAGMWCGVRVEDGGSTHDPGNTHGAGRGGHTVAKHPYVAPTAPVRFIYRLRGDVGEQVVETRNDNWRRNTGGCYSASVCKDRSCYEGEGCVIQMKQA